MEKSQNALCHYDFLPDRFSKPRSSAGLASSAEDFPLPMSYSSQHARSRSLRSSGVEITGRKVALVAAPVGLAGWLSSGLTQYAPGWPSTRDSHWRERRLYGY